MELLAGRIERRARLVRPLPLSDPSSFASATFVPRVVAPSIGGGEVLGVVSEGHFARHA
jgi:hypothetical protein